MQIAGKLILFIAVFLTACGDKTAIDELNSDLSKARQTIIGTSILNQRLETENQELKLKIKEVYSGQSIRLARLEKEAAIAHACRYPFNFNVCSDSMVKAGDEAIRSGVSGIYTTTFWLLLFAKFIIPAFIILIYTIVYYEIKKYRLNPVFSKAEKAQEILAGFESEKERAKNELSKLKDDFRRQEEILNDELASYEITFIKMEDRKMALEKVIRDLEKSARSQKENDDLLKGFQF